MHSIRLPLSSLSVLHPNVNTQGCKSCLFPHITVIPALYVFKDCPFALFKILVIMDRRLSVFMRKKDGPTMEGDLHSASAGSCGGWGYARMPTITTGGTERQIMMPKKQGCRSRSETSTTAITGVNCK